MLLLRRPQLAATLYHPASGRKLEILTNTPAFAIYTGWAAPPSLCPHLSLPSVGGAADAAAPSPSGVCHESSPRSD